MSDKTGGPAFPHTKVTVYREQGLPDSKEYWDFMGLTVRDYFATHASEEDIKFYQGAYGCRRAEARYLHADDMLKARHTSN